MPQGILPFQLKGERSNTQVTAFVGALAYIELMVASGLLESVRRHLAVRAAGNQGWTDLQFVLTLLLLNLLGGEGVSDVEVLEADEGLGAMTRRAELKGLTGGERRAFKARFRGARVRNFPSQTATHRYLEAFHDEAQEELRQPNEAFIPEAKANLLGLGKVNADLLGFVQKRAPSKVATLDQDATLIETEKREALYCYKSFPAYQPLNVYWAERDLMVHSEFRDGNVPAGFQQLRVLEEALTHLPEGVEKVMLRSDSAGYQSELMRYCAEGRNERFGVIEFAIGIKVSDAFKHAVAQVAEEDWRPLLREVGGEQRETGQEWAEVCFVPNSLSTKKNGPTYRFLATREPIQQLSLPGTEEPVEPSVPTVQLAGEVRYKVFGMVTNRTVSGDEVIWWLRERCGRSEAVHAVLKHDLAAGRLPSKRFGANAAWWALAVLAANVNSMMRHLVLGGEWAHKRAKALRFGFINLAARLVAHARTVVLRVSSRHPGFGLLVRARARIVALAQAPT